MVTADVEETITLEMDDLMNLKIKTNLFHDSIYVFLNMFYILVYYLYQRRSVGELAACQSTSCAAQMSSAPHRVNVSADSFHFVP